MEHSGLFGECAGTASGLNLDAPLAHSGYFCNGLGMAWGWFREGLGAVWVCLGDGSGMAWGWSGDGLSL